MFGDALSSEQIKGVNYLGPSYMYSFLGEEVPLASDNSLYSGIFDVKDGLSSKIIFGLNAQVFVCSYGNIISLQPLPSVAYDILRVLFAG